MAGPLHASDEGPSPDIELTEEEREWLRQHPVIRHVPIPDYAANSYLRDRFPEVRYRSVPDVETGLEATSLGSVDAMVLGLPVASSNIARTQITNLRAAGKTGYVYQLRFGVRADQPILRRILDKAMGSITASTHSTIYGRWISLGKPPSYVETWNFWYSFFALFGGLLVLLGAGAVWNWSLRREVDRRTEQLRTAKAEAEEMNRLKSAFLANMNHEFRTPLTAIIGFSDSLVEADIGERARQFSRHIHENGKRLLETLDSVLHLSQLEAGSVSLEEESVRVTDEVERLVSLFRTQAQKKNVSLSVDRPEAPLSSHLDPAAFQRILSTLLSNALKFTEAGDEVIVRVQRGSSDLVVEVEDTGVGISPEFIPKLYEEFEQESTGMEREYEGVGLGLAIARKLTEMMGGSIAVESVKGTGTRFTVRIPRGQPQSSAEASGVDVPAGAP